MAVDRPCSVYLATNQVNGKTYVGISISVVKRWKKHKYDARSGKGKHAFACALRKHGADNFTWQVLAEFPSEPLAKQAEIYTIAQGYGDYNETKGGGGCSGLSPAAQAKKSAALKGRPKSEETRRNMSLAQQGHYVSQQAKLKMSESRLAYLKEYGGYVYPEEVCLKISAALKGKPKSQAARNNMSKAKLGKRNTEEHKANISKGLNDFWATPEAEVTREKHRKNSTGRTHTPEARAKIKAAWVVRKQNKSLKV